MVQKKITDGNFTMCRNPKGRVKTVKRFLYKSEDLVSFTVSIVSILQLSHEMYQRDEDRNRPFYFLTSKHQNLRINKEVKEEGHVIRNLRACDRESYFLFSYFKKDYNITRKFFSVQILNVFCLKLSRLVGDKYSVPRTISGVKKFKLRHSCYKGNTKQDTSPDLIATLSLLPGGTAVVITILTRWDCSNQ